MWPDKSLVDVYCQVCQHEKYLQTDTTASKTSVRLQMHQGEVNRVGVAFIVPRFHIKVGKRISNKLQYTQEKCLHYY